MAYMSQEKKKELAPKIKSVLARYGMKGTIAVRNHMTLVVNIKSGDLDVIGNFRNTLANRHHAWDHDTYWIKNEMTYQDVNHYHLDSYSGKVFAFLQELVVAMHVGNHDNSDTMTDYFDVGWYIDINIGKWNKPYILTGEPEAKSERLVMLEEQYAEKEAA
jgi:cell division protein FtsI/penicillin-binding protein 2